MTRAHSQRGFSLLELLLVVLITGILAAVLAPVIREPVRAYFEQTGRADLVYMAEMALRRVARDARRSLPYSLRVEPGRDAVEFVGVTDVARYRETGGGPAQQRLRFNAPDGAFNLIGKFVNHTAGTLLAPVPLPPGERLVIFNLAPGSVSNDIYQGHPVATPIGAAVSLADDGTEHRVTIAPDHHFSSGSSPSRRVYIASGPVSYGCFNGGFFRHSDYGYLSAQPAPSTLAGGSLLTDNVTDCEFHYDAGNSARPGLLVMKLTLTRAGESITLLHQVHIPNAT